MNVEITEFWAKELIAEQFPKWFHLPIKPVEFSGHDNRTFHLGDEMLIRWPSAAKYVGAVSKEHKWLPILAPNLSFHIPKPWALGKPSKNYPWNWSIYKWIEGKSANSFDTSSLNLFLIASDLAKFLNELHKIDIIDGPVSGTHITFGVEVILQFMTLRQK